jgi:predicted porin
MYKNETLIPKLIAIATGVLLSGGIAHAQSSVTLYGIVDSGLIYIKSPGEKGTIQANDSGLSPSLFGLTGKEDLGGGLKTIYRLEGGFSATNGGFADSNGNFFGRNAYVGLEGNFGTALAGLQYSPFFLTMYETDPRGAVQFGSAVMPYIDNIYGTGFANSNALSYTTPKLWGLQGSVMVALGGTAGDFQAGRQYSASLKYDNGTLMLKAAYYDGNNGGNVETSLPTTVEFLGRMIGASYKIGPVTVKASATNYKVAASAGNLALGLDPHNNYVYAAGLDYQALPQLDLSTGVYYTRDKNDSNNHSITAALGASYFLSHRTTLYAQFGFINNHGTEDGGLTVINNYSNQAGNTYATSVGIRHTF